MKLYHCLWPLPHRISPCNQCLTYTIHYWQIQNEKCRWNWLAHFLSRNTLYFGKYVKVNSKKRKNERTNETNIFLLLPAIHIWFFDFMLVEFVFSSSTFWISTWNQSMVFNELIFFFTDKIYLFYAVSIDSYHVRTEWKKGS